MKTTLLSIRSLALLFAAVPALAQTAPPAAVATPASSSVAKPAPKKPKPKANQPSFNPNVILLDAAHGGSDNGAKLSDSALEKDATLAFAQKLKTLLTAHGFTVVMTRDSDVGDVSSDARIEAANRSRAVACVLLHASSAGHGVHLYTSSLIPLPKASSDTDDGHSVQPWESAQAASLAQSQRLAADLSNALYAIRFPLVVGRASIAPIDSMNCPAIALELAPVSLVDDSNGQSPATDAGYQQRVAEAVAAGLAAWRGHADPHPASAAATPQATAPKPRPVAAPKPKAIPVETPDVLTPPKPKAPAKIPASPAPEPPTSGGTPP